MAGRAEIAPDWAPVARRIRDEATDDWDDKVAADRFTGKGGILVRGHGRISAPGEVTVTPAAGRPGGEPQVLRARRGIVLAAGTTAAVPPVPGLAGTPFWTNHEAIAALTRRSHRDQVKSPGDRQPRTLRRVPAARRAGLRLPAGWEGQLRRRPGRRRPDARVDPRGPASAASLLRALQ